MQWLLGVFYSGRHHHHSLKDIFIKNSYSWLHLLKKYDETLHGGRNKDSANDRTAPSRSPSGLLTVEHNGHHQVLGLKGSCSPSENMYFLNYF